MIRVPSSDRLSPTVGVEPLQAPGYPEGAGGLFTSGGSAASVDAFVAAREAAGHPERATVYMSDQSHSALSRAAMIVGERFGSEALS